MSIFNRFQTFATNGTVDAASLHNLIDATTIRQGLITSYANTTSVGTNYELLIADGTNPNANPNAVTVYDLFQDALTAGTYTNANISEALTYGTAAFTLSTVEAHNGSGTTNGTVALTGTVLGDMVIGSLDSLGSATGSTGLIIGFHTTGANVVRFSITNPTSTAGTVPAGTLQMTALRFTA